MAHLVSEMLLKITKIVFSVESVKSSIKSKTYGKENTVFSIGIDQKICSDMSGNLLKT